MIAKTSKIVLVNDDCIEHLSHLESNRFELCVTDLPYGVVNRKSNGLRTLHKGTADNETFPIEPFLERVVRVTFGSVYVFCATEQVSEVRHQLIRLGLSTRLGVWEKTNPSPMNGQHLWLSSIECVVFGKKPKAVFNEHCKSPVFRFPVPRHNGHPTPKPIALCERLITASSKEGSEVLDPLMGGGNVGIAAVNTRRDFYGIETNHDYFQVAKKNIENVYTPKK